MINGDCAYLRGETGDYATFANLLDPVRAAQLPVRATLGNHDDRANFRQGLAEAKERDEALSDKQVALVRSQRANWFLLDSLELTNKTPGLLGEAQLKWLAAKLDAQADKPAIVFAHHNLFFGPGENKGALKDTAPLMELMRPRRHVKAFIFGHTHNWSLQEDESGIHLINLPPVAYVFNKSRPNGWVEAVVKPDGLRLKLHALNREHPEHGQVKELKWRQA
ncbi:MAG: metallophosphoesterase [Pedosphaera parvula]|nr:metallophosphoesterase [Pedosphaera parvula]